MTTEHQRSIGRAVASTLVLAAAWDRPFFSGITLSIELGSDGAPPSEFRIFKPGPNETRKGTFVFDAAAAKSVMADYKMHGADVMIDLEHQSLSNAPSPDPTSKDARGWCQLELRPDGSLWATNVKWTPDGATRLSEKRQRYVSPAFDVDPKTKRITMVLNVAITSIPATHHTPALVAASGGPKGKGMNLTQFMAVCKVLGLDPDKTDITDAMAQIQGGAPAPAPSSSGSITDPDAPQPPETTSDAPQPGQPPAPKDKNQDVTASMVAVSQLMKLAGVTDLPSLLPVATGWRNDHIALATERAALAADRATLEGAERRKLGGELVVLGAEFPATVWTDDAAMTLKPRWAKMDLVELRAHVADQRAARGRGPAAVTPPPGGGMNPAGAPGAGPGQTFVVNGRTVELSATQLAICKQTNCDPADFAALTILGT